MRSRMIRMHPMTCQLLTRKKKEAEQDGEYHVAKRIRAVLLNHDGYINIPVHCFDPCLHVKMEARIITVRIIVERIGTKNYTKVGSPRRWHPARPSPHPSAHP